MGSGLVKMGSGLSNLFIINHIVVIVPDPE